MSKNRVDRFGRSLNVGEYQRTDGRYLYKYMDDGVVRYAYSWTLNPDDKTTHGLKKSLSLREKEREIHCLSAYNAYPFRLGSSL